MGADFVVSRAVGLAELGLLSEQRVGPTTRGRSSDLRLGRTDVPYNWNAALSPAECIM